MALPKPRTIFMVRACPPKPWSRQGRPPGMGHQLSLVQHCHITFFLYVQPNLPFPAKDLLGYRSCPLLDPQGRRFSFRPGLHRNHQQYYCSAYDLQERIQVNAADVSAFRALIQACGPITATSHALIGFGFSLSLGQVRLSM
jgi:hypothetical protein